MRKTSIRELHIHTSELVREAEEGGVIVIERRGEPVAELRPLAAPRRVSREQIEASLARIRKIWEGMPKMDDSTPLLEEDRNRY
jgi:prevent-host-death family protein